jgi:predicted RNA-binding Zn-ribbon protein involved in translation (DUF1610 family)
LRYSAADFVDPDDVARERSRAQPSRQLCSASYRQLMVRAGSTVACPECGRTFDRFERQRDRDVEHPIVPSHLPDQEGAMRILTARRSDRSQSRTPRPW